MGRNQSLADIGYALQRINKDYYVDVYSAEQDEVFIHVLKDCRGIRFHGAVPYTDVMRLTEECDVTIIVEGFSKQDIDTTRYSLSTKAADAIASGGNIFVYGDINCGVIEYMQESGCAVVCTEQDKLEESLRRLIFDSKLQHQLYERAIVVDQEDHDKEKNRTLTEQMFVRLIEDTRKKHEEQAIRADQQL